MKTEFVQTPMKAMENLRFEMSKPDGFRRTRMSRADKELSHRLGGGLQKYQLARMKQDVKGGLTRWRKGEVVKAEASKAQASRKGPKLYTIEKVKVQYPFLAGLNQCCGIPASVLEFI